MLTKAATPRNGHPQMVQYPLRGPDIRAPPTGRFSTKQGLTQPNVSLLGGIWTQDIQRGENCKIFFFGNSYFKGNIFLDYLVIWLTFPGDHKTPWSQRPFYLVHCCHLPHLTWEAFNKQSILSHLKEKSDKEPGTERAKAMAAQKQI